jgi:hypothetical protein
MRGDFSSWNKDGAQNFRGTLHQQGRVLLDRDWNAQTEINNAWQGTAGRDAFGAGVAAIPGEVPESFKVTRVEIEAGLLKISATKGRVWADGLLLEAAQDISKRTAAYLNLPAASLPNLALKPRDAVILETWLEDLSPFQLPALLIEPALGGVDTTERVLTACRFRLYRMEDGETCDSIIPKLKDDFSTKGRLTVKINPNVVIDGDCPVVESGGYTGFEHRLYRIEIAQTDKAGNWFRWSQFNGGLVGTGDFDAASRKVAIHGNLNAIIHSGLSDFYLEALDLDEGLGCWRVIYAAKAALGPDNMLALPPAASANEFLGTLPPAPARGKRFFRLWNGIEPIASYLADKDLPDLVGIKLKFDADGAGKYTPSDFWTFEVRAGGIGNPAVLVGDPVTSAGFPPQGIFYHRVPLAEVTWTGGVVTGDAIEDCRRVFQPLTKLATCCTYRVGDGIHSHGDFTKIQLAVDALPKAGGEICVLPGLYVENVHVHRRVDVAIHGCGPRTRVSAVVPADGMSALPAFLVTDSTGIVIEDLAIEAGPRSAMQIGNSRHVAIHRCLLQMRDVSSIWQAIYSRGDDVLIEGNTIEILPRAGRPLAASIPPPAGDALAPQGQHTPSDPITLAASARGGIQLAGGSDRVRVFDNLIHGGTWNGITLGSLEAVESEVGETPDVPATDDPCDQCRPPDLTEGGDADDGRVRFVSAGDLYDIEIAGNRISDMGINGIGVVRYFDLAKGGDMIGVHGLHITSNVITRCMRLEFAQVDKSMERLVGYGGIALAKVSDLRILRNDIVGNGADHRTPICGVFAIFVQGMQVDENRIHDNGHRSDARAGVVQTGVRGGVHIWLVLPMIEQSIGGRYTSSFVSTHSVRDGLASGALRDNMIVAPLGRALTFFSLGPVVIARNRLQTQGTTGQDLDLLAATILVGNLGISNEWTLGLLLILILSRIGKAETSNLNYCSLSKVNGMVKTPAPPVLWPPLVRDWATGPLLLTENQVTLDVMDEPTGATVSSVLVFSLDDVAIADNRFEVSSTDLFVLANAFVLGGSVRVSDNRFSETWMRSLRSAITGAGMNTTTDNQSTHCIKATALLPGMLMFRNNLALVEAFCPGECRQG